MNVRFRLRCVALVIVSAVAWPTSAVAQTHGLFGCDTGTNHERWPLKTRAKPPSLAGAKTIALATILHWAIPAGHTDAEHDAIKPREPKLYTVTGFVRKVKFSDDPAENPDCDLHLELAASGDVGATRVIVEIPRRSTRCSRKPPRCSTCRTTSGATRSTARRRSA